MKNESLEAQESLRYKVTYKYVTPGCAGPFKGFIIWTGKGVTFGKVPKKGEHIYMCFGEAITTSVKVLKRSP